MLAYETYTGNGYYELWPNPTCRRGVFHPPPFLTGEFAKQTPSQQFHRWHTPLYTVPNSNHPCPGSLQRKLQANSFTVGTPHTGVLNFPTRCPKA
ncbi:MAG: hypothetical protein HOF10_03525 [Chloroflexi bacterium]|nr:hypothetical protein [Chloroflexota bacterium]MBT4532890.1 hypothetical protein [Chloroflexota bacterium]MBT6152147.1 hypothetical protein [Chloroflexota bacterium]MBT6358730.1 hypothetical protein [Chloroflexota bacterium]